MRALADWAISIKIGLENGGQEQRWPGEHPPRWFQRWANQSPQQLLDWEDEFARFFVTKPKEELQREASKRGIMLFPCTNMADCYHDQQLAARDFWVTVSHPELGDSLTYPGAPLKLNEAPWQVSRRPPLIGEHNGEIYGGELGFSEGELARFQERKVI